MTLVKRQAKSLAQTLRILTEGFNKALLTEQQYLVGMNLL